MNGELHTRFKRGILINAQAKENLLNNQLYILENGEIRYAKSSEDWLTKQIVYVNNEMYSSNYIISQGEHCRCFLVAIIAL